MSADKYPSLKLKNIKEYQTPEQACKIILTARQFALPLMKNAVHLAIILRAMVG